MATSTAKKNGSAKTLTNSELADQIDILKQDIGALTQMLAEAGKDATKAKVAQARDAGAEAAELARAKAEEAGHSARSFVINQPATAIGIAAGIGFLLGYMGRSK